MTSALAASQRGGHHSSGSASSSWRTQASHQALIRPKAIQDYPMTTVAKLLARKRQLLDRLQQDPGPNERAEIERLLADIDATLDLLEEVGPGEVR
jgi:hypothetical protein